jgi:hypothetical protein
MAQNGSIFVPRAQALGPVPLDDISKQLEQQLTQICGARIVLCMIAVNTGNGALDMASGMGLQRTIAALEAVIADLKKQGKGGLILPSN